MSSERRRSAAAAIDAAAREAVLAYRLRLARAVGRIARDYHDSRDGLSALHKVQAAIDACLAENADALGETEEEVP